MRPFGPLIGTLHRQILGPETNGTPEVKPRAWARGTATYDPKGTLPWSVSASPACDPQPVLSRLHPSRLNIFKLGHLGPRASDSILARVRPTDHRQLIRDSHNPQLIWGQQKFQL